MPKLPSFSSRQIISLIKKRGFALDHTTGSHYIFYRSADKRRVTVPHPRKNLAKGTILAILKQAGISREELD